MDPASTESNYSLTHLAGAVGALLVTVWFTLPIFVPSMRGGWRWGDTPGHDMPMSPIGHASWAVVAFAFAITLGAEGVHYTRITRHTGWVLGGAFIFLCIGHLADYMTNRKK